MKDEKKTILINNQKGSNVVMHTTISWQAKTKT